MQDTCLMVATLIAAVTLEAFFIAPAGCNSEKGEDLWAAMLSNKAAFQTFLVLNGCAFVVSIFAVLIYLLARQGNKRKFYRLFSMASVLTVIATILMVVAFPIGTYVVLLRYADFCAVALIMAVCKLHCSMLAKPVTKRSRRKVLY